MHCIECGASQPDSARFCGQCGAELPATDLALFNPKSIPNPQHTYAYIGLGISLLSALMMALPIMELVDVMNGGGAMLLVGLLLFIMGWVIFALFRKRALLLDRMLQGKELLAYWEYSPEEWSDFTKEAFEERKSANKATFLLIAVISVVVMGLFMLAMGFDEASLLVGAFMLGFLVLLGGVAALSAWLPYRRRRRLSRGRVLIAQKGLWVEGDLHEWITIGNRLEAVVYESADKRLLFRYSAMNRTGRQYLDVSLPVPSGKEKQAQQLLTAFGKKTR